MSQQCHSNGDASLVDDGDVDMDDKVESQESIDKAVLVEVLDSWRKWVRNGRPECPEYRPDSEPDYDLDYDSDYFDESIPGHGFDPSDPTGGYDEDGAPYGPHHWYSPKTPGYYWAVCRELLRHQHLAMYWFHLIHVPANNAAPLTQQRAFEDDFSA